MACDHKFPKLEISQSICQILAPSKLRYIVGPCIFPQINFQKKRKLKIGKLNFIMLFYARIGKIKIEQTAPFIQFLITVSVF